MVICSTFFLPTRCFENIYICDSLREAPSSQEERRHHQFLSVAWSLSTPPGTDLQAELESYVASPSSYTAPLHPLVKRLLGRSTIFLTRIAGTEPHLHRELCCLLDIMFMFMVPDSPEVSTERSHALLAELKAQEPEGPWALMESESDLQVLPFLLEHVELLLPSETLELLGVLVSGGLLRSRGRQQAAAPVMLCRRGG